ncbi:amidohydrolase 2 [Apiospora saccharicola]|uniref:Amidohydrolase 2 n=1 Tax=Apiospora saccharicola TaxID=335842 RepID=A0ABR1UDR6_9PEZI
MHLVLAGLLAGLLSSLTSGLPATFTDGANREANDELANAIATSPDPTRFRGFCVFPMASPRDAAAELRRCVTTQGFVGALVDAHLANESYYDGPAYDPLWAVAVAFHVPIYPHPVQRRLPARAQRGRREVHGVATWLWLGDAGRVRPGRVSKRRSTLENYLID